MPGARAAVAWGDVPDLAPPPRHRTGEEGFRATSLALFAAGLATFMLLYATQPLLPELARDFDVSAAGSSLTLAASTAGLGLSLLWAGWLSDAVGRVPVMRWSLVVAGALALACAAAPSLPVLVVLCFLKGCALAGLPAVGMAYLTEEVDPGALGRAIGLYVGGNAIGGMSGRLVAGALSDVGGWRLALAGVGVLGLGCALLFARLVPPSRHFVQRAFVLRELGARLRGHLTEPGLLRLDAMGALLMGSFVAVYNALGFRLSAPPFDLGPAAIGAVFLIYTIGSASSATAGTLADRIGRRRVLPLAVVLTGAGLALTLSGSLVVIIVGVAVLTAGFFAGHSVASSWVGRRAVRAPSQASALYLLAYYAGSSIAGPAAGAAWTRSGWGGVVVLCGVLLALALVVSLRLRATPPLAAAAAG